MSNKNNHHPKIMKTLQNYVLTSFTIFLLFLMQTFIHAQDYAGSFEFDGYYRKYEVYLPQNFQANMPLVVSIHGVTETVFWYKTYIVIHEVADTLGFVIVYPQGIINSWNAGVIDPNYNFPVTDDVGFISALIDTMKTKWDIDLSRVYCCGFSLGGAMSFRMASELGHRLAAIASVSGSLFGLADTWHPIQPMPVLYMHGTNDPLVPYQGVRDWWSAQNTIDYWLEKNQCTAPADTFSFPDIVPDDDCTIQKITYTSCSSESEVIHYKGIRMGHSWPSSQTSFGTEGNKNLDINANIEILNFFKKFENPLVNMAYSKSIEVYPFNVQSLSDTLTISASVNNPENHTANIYAFIHGEQFTFKDSIQLYDDGLHSDGDSSDNIWGNIKLLTGLPEDTYKVYLLTHDLDLGIEQYHHKPARFINFGPVDVGDYIFDESDTEPNPGDRLRLKLTLKNNSTTATATNIKARLISLDTLVSIVTGNIAYDDITAGENSTAKTYAINISEECPVDKEIHIAVNISSYDHICWSDTVSFIVREPSNIEEIRAPVTRIYPNPANNMLIIEISTIGSQGIEIEILTVTGTVIYQQEYKNINAYFVKQIDLSGYAKGIYLVKVKHANTVYDSKVVVK